MRTGKRFIVGPRTGEVGAEVMSALSARKAQIVIDASKRDVWVGDHESNCLVLS